MLFPWSRHPSCSRAIRPAYEGIETFPILCRRQKCDAFSRAIRPAYEGIETLYCFDDSFSVLNVSRDPPRL